MNKNELYADLTNHLTPNTPYLDTYTTNLNEKILTGNEEDYRVYERSKEIHQLIYGLLRKTKNSPVLLGEAGVGKTAIVEGLAVEIINGNVPSELKGVEIRSLELSSLFDSSGDVIFKLRKIIEELKLTKGKNLLFIDEIHTLMGAGKSGKSLDGANVLKPALARGEIQLIGSTTYDEYSQYIESDKALDRRFQKVQVNEPSESQSIKIVELAKKTYEKFHSVKITNEAVKQSVLLSERYIPEKYLPDKSFDLIDMAATFVKASKRETVTEKDIAYVIENSLGIPVTTILKNKSDRFNNIEERLKRKLIGQDFAIKRVADAVLISQAGLQDESKPLGSMMFLGTTGVGKTELAKQLAMILFDSERSLIRIDMSEFNYEGASLKLIGTKDKKGKLTDEVKKHPYSVVLFDELEKASTETHDILLQILDDGIATDGSGRTVDFKNCFIILTTNVGAQVIKDSLEMRGAFEKLDEIQLKQFFKEISLDLEVYFKPEFLNRIGNQIVFNMLNKTDVREIVRLSLKNLNQKLSGKNLFLDYDDKVVKYISDVGYDEENGARPIARAINNFITAPISRIFLEKILKDSNESFNTTIKIHVEGRENDFTEIRERRYLSFEIL